MSISFGGLQSGLPVDEIIQQLLAIERRPITLLEERVKSLKLNDAQFKNVQSRADTLLTTLKQLTAQSVLDQNLFKAKTAVSSDESIATATASEKASAQTLTLEVVTLATSTKAQSQSGVGQLITGASPISDIAENKVTSGNFTVFVDGVANTITVDNTQDVESVLSQIRGLAGINDAQVVNGRIQLDFGAGTTVNLGANGDDTNFLDLTYLKTGTNTGTSISSSNDIIALNRNIAVSDANANFATAITDGTFTIGKATFDTTGKTLNQIISEINNTPEAGVTASFNVGANRLELTATTTGSALITLEDGTSNFLTATGLIVGGDTTVSQTAGTNAEFVLNGATLYSASNTVSEGITGITGVTLELKKQAPGTTVEITIAQDSAKLKEKVKEFVTNYNALVTFIDEQINPESTTAALKGETGLRRFRNSLRTTAGELVAGLTKFPNLAMVGISTGPVTDSATKSSPKLQFDEAKFDAALAGDASEVQELMIGVDGIITRLQTLTGNALHDDPDSNLDGLFHGHANTIAKRIEDVNRQISRMEDRLLQREDFLRKQFTVMENLIAQAQSQGNALNGLMAQLTANNS